MGTWVGGGDHAGAGEDAGDRVLAAAQVVAVDGVGPVRLDGVRGKVGGVALDGPAVEAEDLPAHSALAADADGAGHLHEPLLVHLRNQAPKKQPVRSPSLRWAARSGLAIHGKGCGRRRGTGLAGGVGHGVGAGGRWA